MLRKTPRPSNCFDSPVDGADRPIRRRQRKDSQTFTSGLGKDALESSHPVAISCTYRTVTSADGFLIFDIEQPTKDLRVGIDYTGCDIGSVSTLDFVPTVRPSRIERSPESLLGKIIRAELPGWIFPRSGIAFIWSLDHARSQPAKN